MKKNNLGPVFVALLMLLFFAFWWLVLSELMSHPITYERVLGNRDVTPVQRNVPVDFYPIIGKPYPPVQQDEIEIDSVHNRRIVGNRINIALGNKSKSILEFAAEFKNVYPSSAYEVIFMDSVINRMQVKIPRNQRKAFRNEVKSKMSQDTLLVWEEALFTTSKYNLNDPYLTDSGYSWYLDQINIQNAWSSTYGNSDVTIAVLDNGFDLSHPELQGKAQRGYNATNGGSNVSASRENHGTHVASTAIGKRNNNSGLAGICPDCSFMPVKIQDDNGYITSSYVIDGILYAVKNNADVVNLSLGLDIPLFMNPPLQEQEQVINLYGKDEEAFWKELFAFAERRKTICILASGNSNLLTGIDPLARSEKTIKVGAIAKQGTKAPFSNYGQLTTVYAPGVQIMSAKPGNSYEFLDGTSMAAPIVSGFIGLIKSQNKDLSNEGVFAVFEKNIIKRNNLPVLNITTIQ